MPIYSKSSHSVPVCPKNVLHFPKSTLCEALNRPQKLVKKNYTNPNHYYINLHYLNNFGPKRKLPYSPKSTLFETTLSKDLLYLVTNVAMKVCSSF